MAIINSFIKGVFGVVTSIEKPTTKSSFRNLKIKFNSKGEAKDYTLGGLQSLKYQYFEKIIDYSKKFKKEIFIDFKDSSQKEKDTIQDIYFAEDLTVQGVDKNANRIIFTETPIIFSYANVNIKTLNWVENITYKVAYQLDNSIVFYQEVDGDPFEDEIDQECIAAKKRLMQVLPNKKTLDGLNQKINKLTCSAEICRTNQTIYTYDISDKCSNRAEIIRKIIGSYSETTGGAYGDGYECKKMFVRHKDRHSEICIGKSQYRKSINCWGNHVAVFVEVKDSGPFIIDPGVCDSFISIADWRNKFVNFKDLEFIDQDSNYLYGFSNTKKACNFERVTEESQALSYKNEIRKTFFNYTK